MTQQPLNQVNEYDPNSALEQANKLLKMSSNPDSLNHSTQDEDPLKQSNKELSIQDNISQRSGDIGGGSQKGVGSKSPSPEIVMNVNNKKKPIIEEKPESELPFDERPLPGAKQFDQASSENEDVIKPKTFEEILNENLEKEKEKDPQQTQPEAQPKMPVKKKFLKKGERSNINVSRPGTTKNATP